MKKKIKYLLIAISSFIIICILSVLFIFIYLFSPVDKNNKENIRFEVPYGSNAYQITQSLYENGLIRNKKIFYYLILRPNYLHFVYPDVQFPETLDFKSGVYKLNKGMNYADFILLFSSGKSEYVKVSIPEGLTIKKIAQILDEKQICSKQDFINSCHNEELLKRYNIPSSSFEGYLFPDTYNFDAIMDSDLIVQIMADNFFNKIKDIPSLDDKTPQQLYKIITLASIVEREYKLEEEAPLIASVFSNRIRDNIGLYSCATIEYIITEILDKPHPEKIYDKDLKIDNPYNTYMWRGLPPGPISNPGFVAINATANPAQTDYFFFQVQDPSIGKHVFNKTFDEHKLNHILLSK